MTPTVYQFFAARTLPAGMANRDRLSMLALGVVGEWAEYEQALDAATKQEEAGDVLWYIAGLCTVLGVDMAILADVDHSKMLIVDALGDICETTKKHLYHGKDLNRIRILRGCAKLYAVVAKQEPTAEIMAANVDKLKARWPDGFRVCA